MMLANYYLLSPLLFTVIYKLLFTQCPLALPLSQTDILQTSWRQPLKDTAGRPCGVY